MPLDLQNSVVTGFVRDAFRAIAGSPDLTGLDADALAAGLAERGVHDAALIARALEAADDWPEHGRTFVALLCGPSKQDRPLPLSVSAFATPPLLAATEDQADPIADLQHRAAGGGWSGAIPEAETCKAFALLAARAGVTDRRLVGHDDAAIEAAPQVVCGIAGRTGDVFWRYQETFAILP